AIERSNRLPVPKTLLRFISALLSDVQGFQGCEPQHFTIAGVGKFQIFLSGLREQRSDSRRESPQRGPVRRWLRIGTTVGSSGSGPAHRKAPLLPHHSFRTE